MKIQQIKVLSEQRTDVELKNKYNNMIQELEGLMKEYKERLDESQESDRRKVSNESKTLTASEIFSKAYKRFKTHCLAPYQYKNGHGEAFAKLVQIDSLMDGEESSVIKIHLALMTPQMLFTDYYFYCRNAYWVEDSDSGAYAVLDELYKPYYYAFNLYEGTNFDESVLDKLEKRGENGDYGWFNIKIMSEKGENDTDALEGKLCFAASKYEIRDVFIKVKEEVDNPDLLKAIEAVDFVPDKKTFSKDLSKIEFFQNTSIGASSEIAVYNVGQANCIYIYLRDGQGLERRIFFDVGRPFEEIEDKNTKICSENTDLKHGTAISENLNNRIGYCKPHLIILSHWHYDHVHAILSLSRHAYEDTSCCKWLAPMPHDKALNCYKRIINYLIIRDKIVWIDDTYKGGCAIDQTDVKLYRGNGGGGDGINESSLLLRIKNTLLSGDCMYRFWPDMIQKDINQIETLIVPHHASKLSFEDINVINNISKSSRKIAVICTGQNGYGHPTLNHKASLKTDWRFSEIIVTGDDVKKSKYCIDIS